METKLLEKKLKKLEILYQDALINESLDIKSIHKLRVSTRELLSCFNEQESFYKKLKRVIKLTNEIRDIDVFQTEFLQKLPLKLKKQIDLDLIEIHLKEIRDLDVKKFQEYISILKIPQSITPREIIATEFNDQIEKRELKKFTQKELHRYRLYIKKELYFCKAFHPKKRKKIKILTKLKDYLGVINDNYNAKQRIVTFISVNEKVLLSYIEKENKKYLKKVLNLKLTLES